MTNDIKDMTVSIAATSTQQQLLHGYDRNNPLQTGSSAWWLTSPERLNFLKKISSLRVFKMNVAAVSLQKLNA